MARLDKEREELLTPVRLEVAKKEIMALGYKITFESKIELRFAFKGAIISYFVYSGWASGKTIKDGRGLENLLKQIQTK